MLKRNVSALSTRIRVETWVVFSAVGRLAANVVMFLPFLLVSRVVEPRPGGLFVVDLARLLPLTCNNLSGDVLYLCYGRQLTGASLDQPLDGG